MAKRCGCASDVCSCYLVAGDGIAVSGGGTRTNPYLVESDDAGRLLDVQDDNLLILSGVSVMDFKGAGVAVASLGGGEVGITIPGAGPGGLLVKDESTNVLVGTQTLNFVGAGVQATASDATSVNVTITGPPASSAGVVSVPFSNVSSNRVAVTFPVARFSAVPAVVAQPDNTILLFGTVASATASGVQVGAAHRDGTAISGTITVYWFARAMG